MEKNRTQYFLKILLIIQPLGLLIYTVIAIQNDGIDFLGRAQSFIISRNWVGQFTLDFACYLILSALWIAWRGKFSIKSIVLSIFASIFGIIFFAPYLLYLITVEKGNLKKVLIGKH